MIPFLQSRLTRLVKGGKGWKEGKIILICNPSVWGTESWDWPPECHRHQHWEGRGEGWIELREEAIQKFSCKIGILVHISNAIITSTMVLQCLFKLKSHWLGSLVRIYEREGRFHVGAFVTLFVFAPLPFFPLPSRRFVGTSNAAHLPSLGGRGRPCTYGRVPTFLPSHSWLNPETV